MPTFATYLHPHTCYTSKSTDHIHFEGYSYPHFSQVRAELAKQLTGYAKLPIYQAEYEMFGAVHTASYLAALKAMAAGKSLETAPQLSFECIGLEHCLPGYQYSLGGMLAAVDAMKRGALDRAYCFSLGGHHAYADWGHGYCLLNPLAAAARYAQTQGFAHILILDWDIHHGDGTQSIFAHDKSVHLISIHSGADIYIEKAAGLRSGTTTAGEETGHCNIPLLHELFDDNFFEEVKLPGKFYRAAASIPSFQAALNNLPWSPNMIMIFSGYDSHCDDCGKDITNWTNQSFVTLTKSVLEIARQANCPVLSSHGGGYKLPVTVSAAVSHVEVLAR